MFNLMKTANELLYKLKKRDMIRDYKNNFLSSPTKSVQTIHHIQEDSNLDTYNTNLCS
jgi:hypothetical protein